MEHFTFTASQTAALCCVCMAVGIIIGAIWVPHIGGGMLPWSKE